MKEIITRHATKELVVETYALFQRDISYPKKKYSNATEKQGEAGGGACSRTQEGQTDSEREKKRRGTGTRERKRKKKKKVEHNEE